ncbi:hypothetical protein Ait01nite_032160 [Actinoplanes italicus]|uniref:Uncharacterized protein n=1 Tax=Actinoplanes italicus TaxID=113567 RepID=A0A2T0KJG1_9ACTN|nr:DUF6093 family protein [Actinoplanes italicus]PRX23669.1 hypothetical protein CLV67_103418 [Actinoplanes italicus]GIE30171.1 hypothetical protein Ait01nite_032160 [Actinoplanes italicus]
MSRASVLARGRAKAEEGMEDACTIIRIGDRVTDTTTGEVTEPATTLYTGKCRVQQATAQAQREDAGEDRLLMLRLEVQLPMSVTGLEVGDRITITASENDPDLPGRVFRIHDLAHATHKTARRVQCLEVTGS